MGTVKIPRSYATKDRPTNIVHTVKLLLNELIGLKAEKEIKEIRAWVKNELHLKH